MNSKIGAESVDWAEYGIVRFNPNGYTMPEGVCFRNLEVESYRVIMQSDITEHEGRGRVKLGFVCGGVFGHSEEAEECGGDGGPEHNLVLVQFG